MNHAGPRAKPRASRQDVGVAEPIAHVSPATRAWFADAFAAPTPAQAQAWESIAAGDDTLVVAPTGSGKTLAAFLTAIDRCLSTDVPDRQDRCRILYVSPLKALAADVERNLRSPLIGISQAAASMGLEVPDIRVGVRTGDTDPTERRRQATTPPDIFITTPESLFLLLTSSARESLRGVETVIIDEIHALAGTKRGAHLALSLARLDEFVHRHDPERRIQRIGLSATARPVDAIARFLSPSHSVSIVDPAAHKEWDLQVVVPVEDMTDLSADTPAYDGSAAAGPAAGSIWPHVEARLIEEIQRHRSTLVFVNSRRLAERLTSSLNDRWREVADAEEPLVRAHHGSVSREQRSIIEEDLKAGRLRAVVATSSMELGIDMGAIDQVIQVESPPSVASGLQRVGRAGHQVGAVSRGMFFPKYRGDLLQSAVAVDRMRLGAIEELRIPENPLDILAQQIIAMVAMDDWAEADLAALVRSTAPFTGLGEESWESVLDMLAGRYPGDEFAELRPRLVWDRTTGQLTARPGAQRLAVTSGGTIPDRGMFGVYLVGTTMRVGELDEEMVYESRVGDLFALGTSSWRIEDITADRVWVSPAPGEVARMPFWRGDRPGRPRELGLAVGEFLRRMDSEAQVDHLRSIGLDDYASSNLIAYLSQQREATGTLPDDRTIVVERFRDELGDWRVVIHTPLGAQVHAPWALALTARLRHDYDVDPQVMYSDDGIVLRLPDTLDDAAPRAVADLIAFDPSDIEAVVAREIGGSALFAGRFRECAARALLLPRRNPGKRSPLWQQRQRSAHLLAVASRYPRFPIVAETVRECLRDVFDLPGLTAVLEDLQARRISIVDVQTSSPSPFAQSLLFGYVAEFLYDGDAPLAERRAAALTIDTGLLAELLGDTQMRDLIDDAALVDTVRRVRRLDIPVRDHEDLADLLRILGPISPSDAAERGVAQEHIDRLVADRRAILVRIGGHEHVVAIEDAGVVRDALGCALPLGIPQAFLSPSEDPMRFLLSRFARVHGPFTTAEVAAQFGVGTAIVEPILRELVREGRLAQGGFTPDHSGEEWCDAEVLRRIRRASIAALRESAEPVDASEFARFLVNWHGIDRPQRGLDALRRSIDQLAGMALSARRLETIILPSRVSDYSPAMLDQLLISGEVQWWGLASVPGDAWITLAPSDLSGDLLPLPLALEEGTLAERIVSSLDGHGAMFFRDLSLEVGQDQPVTDAELTDALWDLVWTGRVTNDSLLPVRLRVSSRSKRTSNPRSGPRVSRRPGRLGRPGRAPRGPMRSGPPEMAGRWSLLEPIETDPTTRALTHVEVMLDRFGLLSRTIVSAEGFTGGFAAAYKVLSGLEDTGAVSRTYAVEGIGGAQFALPGVIDRLRASGADDTSRAVVLTAADPANPYGASIPWPERDHDGKPTRAAGALCVLVDGSPVLWLDRGLASLLTWPAEPDTVRIAAGSLVSVLQGLAEKVALTRIDSLPFTDLPRDSIIMEELLSRGFVMTPRALTLRPAAASRSLTDA